MDFQFINASFIQSEAVIFNKIFPWYESKMSYMIFGPYFTVFASN